MSGICGFLDLEQARVSDAGLGTSALRHEASGCVISADASLYYRDYLITALGLDTGPLSDTELILAAYQRWGEDCLDRLEGDFAFAIWDPRERRLFCARDRFAMRPFYYHYTPGKCFAFASSARTVFEYPQVPFAINEGRIADFIVPELEWIDYTNTFYEGVYRLPPAHKLIVKATGMQVTEYWAAEPGPELGLTSDQDFVDGFLDVFMRAVEERLRAPNDKVGSMLSGGMDSGSVVATAHEILGDREQESLQVFSLAHPRGSDCIESKRIYATLDHLGLRGTQIDPGDIERLGADPLEGLEEPFDGEMLFAKAIYRAANGDDISVVLDGAGGDVVFNEGRHIARLIRRGRLLRAWREASGEAAFWGDSSALPAMLRHLRAGLVPEFLKAPFRPFRNRREARQWIDASLISKDLADRVDIEARCERLRETFSGIMSRDAAVELARKIRPNLAAGRERYGRIAASAAVEARDPFTDKRVIDFCTRVPGHLMQRDGWPKYLLRAAMQGRLPEMVVWARGKPHIGGEYNRKFIEREISAGALDLENLSSSLETYIDTGALSDAWQEFQNGGNADPVHSAQVLSSWLQQSVTRPVVKDQGFR